MINKIPIEPYKHHKGTSRGTGIDEVKQYSFRGIALNPIEQELVLKVNQILEVLRQ